MDNIKSIISNNKGQKDYNFLPPSVIPATYIKGKKGDTPITMEGIQYPMIALDKYGVTFQQPDQQYNYKSKGVLEMPYMPGSIKKDEEMPTAQRGGSQGDQMQQLIMMYAQMKGVDPQQIIQQLQQLPKNQQQQALESIAQEVQQAMAQQQQQQQMAQQQGDPEQQEAMMGQQDQENPQEQEQEMGQGMMSYGGEPCIDCFDNYNPSPQAQNLNWFYKAQGGEAFPQANTYPEDWASYSGNQYAQGGEAFPQAQTYLPYDREGETRPNFMFEMGGQSDIDKAYQMMKKGGFDIDPKKKKGGKFNHLDAFNEYLEKGGTKLNKYQYDRSVVDETDYDPEFSKAIDWMMNYEKQGSSAGPNGYVGGGKNWGTNREDLADREKAKRHYYDKYWSKVKDLPPGLRTRALQLAVNTGDPYGELMVASGKMSVADRANTKDDRKDKSTSEFKGKDWANNQEAIIDAYEKDPEKFLQSLDAEQNRYYNQGLQGMSDEQRKFLTGYYQGIAPFANDYYNKSYPSEGENTTAPKSYDFQNVSGDYQYDYQSPAALQSWAKANGIDASGLSKAQLTNARNEWKKEMEQDFQNSGNQPAEAPVNTNQPAPSTSNPISVNIPDTSTVSNKPTFSMIGDDPKMLTYLNQYSNASPNVPYNQTLEPKFGIGFKDPNTDRYTYEDNTYSKNNRSIYKVTDNETGKVSYPKYGSKSSQAISNMNHNLTYKYSDDPTYDYSKIAGNPVNSDKVNQEDYNAYTSGDPGTSDAQGYSSRFETPGFNPLAYRNPDRAERQWERGEQKGDYRGKGWRDFRDTKREVDLGTMQADKDFNSSAYRNQNRALRQYNDGFANSGKGWNDYNKANNQTPATSNNKNSSVLGPVEQYVGKLPSAGNLGVKFWDNKNIRKIKGTPDRPMPNIGWNTPGNAYMQGAMNSKLFGSSGLGLALSTLTGAINPNNPMLGEDSTFKAKYRRDGSLRKVKGSSSDVNSFFNPNAGATTANNTSGSTTGNTSGASASSANTSAPMGFGSGFFNNRWSNQTGLDPTAMADFEMARRNRGFAKGGAYHYLPMALMGIPPIDDSLEGSPSYQYGNNPGIQTALGDQDRKANAYGVDGSTQPKAPEGDVKVKTTDGAWWQPNKKRVQGMTAVLGAANGALDTLAANNKQDAATNMMQNQSAMNNPAYNTGNATQTQLGSPATAINSGDVFPGGPGSNIPTSGNYNQQLYNNNRQFVRDGGSIHDLYEDGGEYELTDEEIQQILAAGGSVEYI